MRREAQVLGALSGTDVPHPALIAACPELEPLGAAFYLMEPITGFSPWDSLPESFSHDPSMQRRLGFAMVDVLVALAGVDVDATGLRNLRRSGPWLPRQVPRWLSQLRWYADIDGDTGPRLPQVESVAEWLVAHTPAVEQSGLVHGDFHFGNVLVRPQDATIAAVVDWELATVGDPLLDLGELLATWPSPGGVYASRLTLPALPRPAELVAAYVSATGRDPKHVQWFAVLACFRLGVLLEGTYARARAGLASLTTGETLHARAVGLLEQARDLCERNADDRFV
jgi:aminoglycoside phosphotransferase (APT) family kinase protein